ncbi:MAG: M48 family metalloprotease, partial [bacterium]
MNATKIIIVFPLLALLFGCSLTKPTPLSSKSMEELSILYTQLNRVKLITHNIFIANQSLCSKHKAEYGFATMLLKDGSNSIEREKLTKVLNLHKQPTVTYVVPNSSADRVGLLAGDEIIAVNNTHWSKKLSPKYFADKLAEQRQLSHLKLEVLRDNNKYIFDMSADKSCDINFVLNDTDKHLARARERLVVIDYGSTKLLKDDSELAFFIAHEMAHILLGHTLPSREEELNNHKMHSSLEKDADALGIRLMVKAGYNPKAVETALKKTSLIDSGPITQFFNYHGSYMPPERRIEYLKSVL